MSTGLLNRRSLLRDLQEGRWSGEAERREIVQGFLGLEALPIDHLLRVLHGAGLVQDGERRAQILGTLVEILSTKRDESVVEPLIKLAEAADGHVHEAVRAILPRIATRRSLPLVLNLLKSGIPAVRALGRGVVEGLADQPQAQRALMAHIRKHRRGARGEDLELLCRLAPPLGVQLAAELFNDFTPDERIAACRALGYCPADLAGPVLTNILSDLSGEVRLTAAEALGQLQYRSASDRIADMLSTEDPKQVDRVVKVLSSLGDDRSELHMVRLLTNADARIRLRAIRTLSQVGGREALAPLIAMVNDRNSGLRQQSTEALSAIIQRYAPPVMARSLELMCARSPGVAGAMQEILRQLPPRDIVPRLMAAFGHVSWNVRELSAERMCRLWSVDLTPFFYRFLHDPEPSLRRFGVDMLCRLEVGRDAIAQLVPLLGDPDWWVRERAVEALGRSNDRSLVPRLVDLLTSDPALICITAAALGNLGDPEALAPLLQAFETASSDGQVAVVQALSRLEGDRSYDILQGLCARAEPDVRWAITEALTRMQLGRANRDAGTPALDRLLLFTQERGGTDLFVPCDGPPMVRKNGKLVPALNRALTPDQSQTLIFQILTEEQRRQFELHNDLDFGYEIPHRGRFRANVYRQRNGITAVFRVIPSRIPSPEELGLPAVCYALAEIRQGLILVTGAAGSGKSTTLAALIDHINSKRACHVITLEHPIEFIHHSNMALVTQREIGVHAHSYAGALRATLREDPDVIMVGELKDYETVSMAITAAETGHVVFGTLNTQGAVRAVDRLVNFFGGDEQAQVRTMLADTLRGVLSQQLVWRKDGAGRVAALEVLLGDYRVAKLIRDNKSYQLPNVMAVAIGSGMQTMDQSLMHLVEHDQIAPEEAWRKAQDRKLFRRFFDEGELPPDVDDGSDAGSPEATALS